MKVRHPATNNIEGRAAENRFIREDECARITGLSRTTRWRLERAGQFPSRRQISDNAVAWRLSEVLAWCEAKAATPASDE